MEYLILALLIIVVLPGVVIPFLISCIVYRTILVRTKPEKWGRTCPFPDNEENMQMWNTGVAWAESHKENMREVHIQNDGLNLYGEYYDFGKDRCVIILPGRCESLIYSYFFAPPYEKAGFNVLVIDARSHGKSEGVYNTVGVKESGDLLAWSSYANKELSNQEIYFHCICVGTAAAVFAMEREDCPSYIKGLITEGCFTSFRETFKEHMAVDKRPIHPVLDLVMLHILTHTGTNVYKQTPLASFKRIRKDARVLFLFGKQDLFSRPEKAMELFDACTAEDKRLVWFEQGSHSHLRINNLETYDQAIMDFVKG